MQKVENEKSLLTTGTGGAILFTAVRHAPPQHKNLYYKVVQEGYIMKQYNEQTKTIDATTLYAKADAIAIRAILTDWTKSGNEMMRKLYHSAVNFAMSDHTDDDGNGGADIIHDTVLYLWQYNGKSLDDATSDGQMDKDGNAISILRGAFRNIGATIKRNRQREYKQLYLEDYENENGQIAVPLEWDIDNYADFVRIDETIDSLELTANQYQVLNLKMRGKSNVQTATAKGCSEKNIRKVLEQIRNKYIALYGMPATVQTTRK